MRHRPGHRRAHGLAAQGSLPSTGPRRCSIAPGVAPSAEFVKGDVVDRETEGGFDVVVLAFVLHELDDAAAARVRALSRARDGLAADGCVGILDWSLPRDGWNAGCVAPTDREDRTERRV